MTDYKMMFLDVFDSLGIVVGLIGLLLIVYRWRRKAATPEATSTPECPSCGSYGDGAGHHVCSGPAQMTWLNGLVGPHSEGVCDGSLLHADCVVSEELTERAKWGDCAAHGVSFARCHCIGPAPHDTGPTMYVNHLGESQIVPPTPAQLMEDFIDSGAMTINEARARLGLDPVDEYYGGRSIPRAAPFLTPQELETIRRAEPIPISRHRPIYLDTEGQS